MIDSNFGGEIKKMKDDAAKTAVDGKSKAKAKQVAMSEKEIRWAEATIALRDLPAFKVYQELEADVLVDTLQTAFMVRENVESKKTYGELMAMNEGILAGIRRVPNARNDRWHRYLETMRNKQQDGE